MTNNQKTELELIIRVSVMPFDVADALRELVAEIEQNAVRERIEAIKTELGMTNGWTGL